MCGEATVLSYMYCAYDTNVRDIPSVQLNIFNTPLHICSLHLESIVDVQGVVTASPEAITSCSQQDVELKVTTVSLFLSLVVLGCFFFTEPLPIKDVFYWFIDVIRNVFIM